MCVPPESPHSGRIAFKDDSTNDRTTELSQRMLSTMGCKAEGAAQGLTLLGAAVLFVFGLFSLVIPGAQVAAFSGDVNAVIDLVLGITLILMAILGLDACGFVSWKITRSGLLLAIFGFVSIIIVARGLNFNLLSWLMNAGMLAGLMFIIAGILILTKS